MSGFEVWWYSKRLKRPLKCHILESEVQRSGTFCFDQRGSLSNTLSVFRKFEINCLLKPRSQAPVNKLFCKVLKQFKRNSTDGDVNIKILQILKHFCLQQRVLTKWLPLETNYLSQTEVYLLDRVVYCGYNSIITQCNRMGGFLEVSWKSSWISGLEFLI